MYVLHVEQGQWSPLGLFGHVPSLFWAIFEPFLSRFLGFLHEQKAGQSKVHNLFRGIDKLDIARSVLQVR